MTSEYTATVSESAAADPLVGRLLDGRYQIRSRIARGGMATVYLATDLRLERRVAVKVMHGHLADDAAFRERFIREARSSARLAHPNVVAVFDQGEDRDMAYLVMEYLPGMTLRELLQEHRVLTTEQTFDIMEAVLAGLAAAHKAGIVHRDLKPENVMLADDGRIKIGDFGLARAVSANTATGAALLGTIAYLSPELVTRGTADARSDLYAIGIMMYEMLTGEQPYKGDQPVQIAYQHANSTVPAPSIKNPRVPAELDELVLWATARSPEDRPTDARMLLDQLFETHSSLMTALPGTGSDTGQRTAVFPGIGRQATGETTAYGTLPHDTGETLVLGGRGSRSFATAPTSSVSLKTQTLQIRAARRKRRGWLWLLLVIVLAVGGAGAGWWFGFGPGARVTVPSDLAGSSVDVASGILTGDGFNPLVPDASDPADAVYFANSLEVTQGLVVDVVDANGTSIAGTGQLKGADVHLLLSLGPRMLPLPDVIGKQLADAANELGASFKFDSVPEDATRYYNEADRGTVLDLLDANGNSLKGVATLAEQSPIAFAISWGPIPDVAVQPVDAATKKLTDVGLVVDPTAQQDFSDTVPEGGVIQIIPPHAGALQPGDTVKLDVSKGPQLFPIPDVAGKTINQATKTLTDQGFIVDGTDGYPKGAGDKWTVTGTSPAAGTMKAKGTHVSFTGVNFF